MEKLDFNLNMDIEVTDDAEIQVVFDQMVGDVMKSRGNGDLRFFIDETLDFKRVDWWPGRDRHRLPGAGGQIALSSRRRARRCADSHSGTPNRQRHGRNCCRGTHRRQREPVG